MDKFSPDRIEVQLERVLGSSEFMAGRRLGQFLRYVVEQALNGHLGSMDQYTIAVEAFGYGPDFDPVSNPAVRILARRLRRALDQYFLTQGSDDPIRIDIPKGGYVPVFLDNHAMPKESVPYECPTPAVEVPTLDVSRPTIAIMAFDVLNTDGAFDHVATGLTEEIIITLTQFPEFLVVGPLNRAIILQNQLDTNGIGQQYRVRFLLDVR